MAEKEHEMDGLFRSKLKDLEADPLPSSWDKIQGALKKPAPVPQRSTFHKYWLGATVILIVLIASWVSYQAFNTRQSAQIAGQKVHPNKDQGSRDTISNAVPIVSKDVQSKKEHLEAFHTMEGVEYTATDTLEKIILDDGTIVTLQKGATLALSDALPQGHCESLRGVAFFEVKSNPKPFTLNVGELELSAQHGDFVLVAEPDVQLFVKSGSVHLSAGNSKEIVNAGERISVRKGQMDKVRLIESPNYLSWQTGKLVFDNTHLDQVASDIESYYGVNISLANANLKNCRFTGVFDRQSLDEVLQVLSASFDLKYNHEAKRYILQGDGCK